PARSPQPNGSPCSQSNSASQESSGKCSANRTSMQGPCAALQSHPRIEAGSVRLELKTSRSPARRYLSILSKRVCSIFPVARSITSKRTWSRRMPRRSGGSFALSSGGKTNVNGVLILFCHPERSRRISLFLCRSSKPVRRQIFPARVIALNQGIFLRPSPALQLFLPRNGVTNIPEVRTVNQAGAMIILGESGDLAAAMLRDAHKQIVGNANV